MLEKLSRCEKRYEEIEEKLSLPETMGDLELYKNLMKEYKNLSPIVEKFREYKKASDDVNESEALIAEENDPEMKTLAEDMLRQSKQTAESAMQELKVLMLPKDPNDDKNVIVEIRAGAGGEEASLFAAVLYRMYTMYAESSGFKVELLGCNETELGGFKEISFTVEGENAYSRFKYESGVHRVQRVPETEAQGRIQTSTATVAVLPELEDADFELDMNELEITRHRSAGAGGQHVNKTESAIRIIHVPTGITVDCQDERSQIKNKEKALKIMKSRLADLYNSQKEREVASERRSQVGTGDRSERIRTYNYPQGRVTDHRIGLTLYSLESFLNGRIDEMIDSLAAADRAEKMANSEIGQ